MEVRAVPATCWKSIHGLVARVTRVDECGAPVVGPCSVVTTDGFVTVNYSPEIAEGEEIELRNAAGRICVSNQDCPELKWVNFEIEFCQVDPDLFSLLTGYPVVLDWEGNGVGNRITETVNCQGGAAIEVWTEVPGLACTTTGNKQYGYFLVPWLANGIIGDIELGNDATTFTITGRSKAPSLWGVGPHDVDATDGANPPTAGPLLTPILAGEHMDIHLTTVAPPEPECGCTALPAVP
jgi:hypothetical protein